MMMKRTSYSSRVAPRVGLKIRSPTHAKPLTAKKGALSTQFFQTKAIH